MIGREVSIYKPPRRDYEGCDCKRGAYIVDKFVADKEYAYYLVVEMPTGQIVVLSPIEYDITFIDKRKENDKT